MEDKRSGRSEAGPRGKLEKMRIANMATRMPAIRDLLYDCRQGGAAACLALDEARNRAHPSIARPCRGDWPSHHRDPKYGTTEANDPRRKDPLRAIPGAIERKLHLLARRLILPHPRGGTLDVTAPCRRICNMHSISSVST